MNQDFGVLISGAHTINDNQVGNWDIPTHPDVEIIQTSKVIKIIDDGWGENERYPRFDWKADVANNDTNLGYWEWVAHQQEAE